MLQRLGLRTFRRFAISLALIGCVAGFSWLLSAQDAAAPDYRAYGLRYASAREVAAKLEQTLSQLGAEHEVLADTAENRVFVRGPEPTQRLVRTVIDTLDRVRTAPGNGANRRPPSRRTQPVAPPDASLPVNNGYALRHLRSADLEAALKRLWGNRISWAPTSRGETTIVGLNMQTSVQPVLKIDRHRDAVTFLGPSALRALWRRVVESLDRAGEAGPEATDVVALDRAKPAQVHRVVSLIQAAAQPEGAAVGQDAAPPAGATETLEGGGLLGPVQIEFLEGLDVIVLRGHKRDVERVRQIIDEIERTSQQTQPTIELHPLKFVGSQVMAALVSEIYDQILSPRQGEVSVQALVKPNALLLIGKPESVGLIKQLVAKLDQPARPEAQFEVFRLKHISAVDAQETIQQFFVDRLGEAQQAQGAQGQLRPGLGTRVNAVADYRSNSLIVQASPRDMEEVRRLVAQIDVEEAAAVNEVRIFRLKNALATDLAPVLQDALNWQLVGNRAPVGASRTGTFGAGQAFGQTEERARLRSAILTFMTIDSEGGKLLQSGLLSDVRVTADVNGNALIVTGPSKSMGLIEALVKALDTLPAARAQIKVFTIVNGDATALAEMLQELLAQQAQTGQQAFGGFSTVSPFLQPGLQTAAGTGESTLVPVRFGVDQRTNSIIVTGSAGDLSVVEAVLLRLDEESYRTRRTTVYWLANSPAADVAQAVNDWLDQRRTLFDEQLDASPESPANFFSREVIVVPEPISNSIIISATPEWFEEVKHVVESLDRKPPLIKIDVLIASVRLNDFFELGAEFGIQDALLFDRTYLGTNQLVTGNTQPGYNFNSGGANTATLPLGDIGGIRGNVLGQALSTFAMGRVNAEQGYGGLVLSASRDSISVLIRALQNDGYAQVLNRPQITTLDRQPARVDVGEQVSRLQGTTATNTGVTSDVQDIPTGLLLGVTPQVTPDGSVVMEVDLTRSQLSDTDFVLIPDGAGGTIPQQNIENVEASTTISTRSGQTVVFAGLLTTSKSHQVRGIPWLSTLPGIGPLFRYTQESCDREELLIVLTPHIIRTDEEIDRFRYAESERMSWCLADVIEVYGDKGFGARPGCWCDGEYDCDHAPPTIFPDANPTGQMPPAMMESVPPPQPTTDQGPFLPVPTDPTSQQRPQAGGQSGLQAACAPAPRGPNLSARDPNGARQPAFPDRAAVYEGPPIAPSERQAMFRGPFEQPNAIGLHRPTRGASHSQNVQAASNASGARRLPAVR